MILGLDHVQIAMPRGEESKARAFYADLLSLNEVAKPPILAARGGVWFALPDGRGLHLGVEEPFVPAKKAHPAFAVADLDTLAEKIERANYPVTWDDSIPGTRRFHAADPFGNRLEFLSK